jgi:prephenate dehydrogenase
MDTPWEVLTVPVNGNDPEPSTERFPSGTSLLVVGAGAIGRWLARTLPIADIALLDRDRMVARETADAVSGRVVESASTETFDLVAIAVPISAASEAITTHAPRAQCALIDATGTMADPLEAMATHAPGLVHISLHPLFAPDHAPGRVAMVTGNQPASEDATSTEAARETDNGRLADAIETALRDAGNDPFRTTAAEHDAAMATVQARTHAAVLAFSLAADPIDERFHTPVSAALSRVAARVTDGTPGTYAEIQAAFKGSEDVARAATRIARADQETFEALYRDAGASFDRTGTGDSGTSTASSGDPDSGSGRDR